MATTKLRRPRSAKDRIIMTLDGTSLEIMGPLIDILAPPNGRKRLVGGFQLRPHFTTAVGMRSAVNYLLPRCQSFVDCKLHDTPHEMGRAAEEAAALGTTMFSVHATAGIEGLRAAAQHSGLMMVMASLAVGSQRVGDKRRLILSLAHDALDAGVDGLVCAPDELDIVRTDRSLAVLPKVLLDVRPGWAKATEERRTVTPTCGIKDGADWLVIGSAISRPPPSIGDPTAAAKAIAGEISLALRSRR